MSHEGLSAVLTRRPAASAAPQRADAPPARNVPAVASVHGHASRTGGGAAAAAAAAAGGGFKTTLQEGTVTNLGGTCRGRCPVHGLHVALASAEREPSRLGVSPVRQEPETASAWLQRWSPPSKCALLPASSSVSGGVGDEWMTRPPVGLKTALMGFLFSLKVKASLVCFFSS